MAASQFLPICVSTGIKTVNPIVGLDSTSAMVERPPSQSCEAEDAKNGGKRLRCFVPGVVGGCVCPVCPFVEFCVAMLCKGIIVCHLLGKVQITLDVEINNTIRNKRTLTGHTLNKTVGLLF